MENFPSIVGITGIRNVGDLALNLSTEVYNAQPQKSEPTNLNHRIEVINNSKKELIEKGKDISSMSISSNSLDDNLDMKKVNPWTCEYMKINKMYIVIRSSTGLIPHCVSCSD